MQLKISAKCASVEKGESADVVEFHSQKSDADDVPGSYQVDAVLRLTIDNTDARGGGFEAGKAYAIGVTIAEVPASTWPGEDGTRTEAAE